MKIFVLFVLFVLFVIQKLIADSYRLLTTDNSSLRSSTDNGGNMDISTVSGTTGVPLAWFLSVSAILFCLGLIGVLTRRNVLVIFMSAELMMNAVNLSLIAFGASLNSMVGQNFVVFVVTVAAAEAAVGLAIIISLVRQKPTVDTTDIDLMKE